MEGAWEASKSWYTVTESVEVSCKEGYINHGGSNLTCGSLGEWIDTMPGCKLIGRSLKVIIHHFIKQTAAYIIYYIKCVVCACMGVKGL